jgi:hypothetical protein
LFQIAQLRRRCQFVPAVEARFPNGIVIKGALYSIDNSIEFYETRGNADVILDEFREIGRLLIDMNFKVVSNTADEAGRSFLWAASSAAGSGAMQRGSIHATAITAAAGV